MSVSAHRRTAAVLVLLLGLAALWRWQATVLSPAILPDEKVYLSAAKHLQADRSPYLEQGYFYPPPLAEIVAALSARLGDLPTLRLLRGLSLAGMTAAVWLSLATISWPWWVRLATGVAFLTLAPAIEIATVLGNASGAAIGLVLAGLLGWPKRPLFAGAALGLGLALKPLAPLAPLLLAVHRPQAATRRHLLTAAASLAVSIGACLSGYRYLPGLLANARGHTNPYNFSLHKLLADLGIGVPPLLVAALVTAAAVAWVLTRRLGSEALLTVVLTTSILALPILWAHSLVLLLPVQLLALDRIARRRPIATLDNTLAGLAVLATLSSHAVGTVIGLPTWTGVVSRAVTLAAVPYLGWFVAAGSNGPRSDRRHGSG